MAAGWGYGEDDGPPCWGSLDPGFHLCAHGREQSPVDLAGAREAQLAPPGLAYGQARVTVEDTGRTIQVNPEPGHGLVLDGVRFHLRQFHFHHGSEHLVDGRMLPLEMHLVHRDDDGTVLVVGVFFTSGAENRTLAPVWDGFGRTAWPPLTLDLAALVPDRRTAWRYRGSLTTPPCSEGVTWIVLCEPLAMSARQIAAFGRLYPANRRPVQPLGDRSLLIG